MNRIYHGEDAPCKDCQREIKSVGCHGICEEYKAYQARRKQVKEERYKTKEISEYLFYTGLKRQRKRRR